jgi:DNA-binding Lrp family transcriptional regulator
MTGRPTVVIRATHEDLANAIGSVREVVTRAVDDLQRDGIIEGVSAGIRVLAMDQLQAEALV